MAASSKKRSALGKGLSALLENAETDITSSKGTGTGIVGSIATLPLTSIEANPFNPRSNFEKEALEELSSSIATHGIIQPITVRKLGRDKYQLISGERRFRAAQLAGLTEIPAYVRIANDQAMLEMALVENIQREDLNPIEVALSYERLIEECELTQDQLSQKIAKSRSSITNHLRLLKLPAPVQAGVKQKQITMGHARAIVSAGDEETQIDLFERVVLENLSVREIEAIIRGEAVARKETTIKKRKLEVTETEYTFKEHLSDQLATKVDIKKTPNGSGKIVVNFSSDVDLNRIMELMNRR
ncbi:MAG: ParB/RepB/Spo0J family partition protein [Crocinitomicaceae bacterium]|nr:ParB/RepB/Spo0J family partition protein [Flavobacteriales bacterium]NQZ35131.1 ParB/RepB/Spo0J family partition protein [Crocinitomicaceae bacterium]